MWGRVSDPSGRAQLDRGFGKRQNQRNFAPPDSRGRLSPRGLCWSPHERDARAHIVYCTLTVTVAVLRLNWLVEYRVYVVVWVGWTITLAPRTAPTCGEMIT
jgi:hypothetical protein